MPVLTGPDTQKFILSASYIWTITLTDADLSGITLTKAQMHLTPVNPDHTAFNKDSDSNTDWIELTSGTLWTIDLKIPLSPSDIPTGDSKWIVEIAAEVKLRDKYKLNDGDTIEFEA